MMSFESLKALLIAHRLTIAIASAIGISLLMTVINVSLYVSSGASRLDLSRPGYEAVRTKVDNAADDDTLSASGPMSVTVLDEFQALYTKKRATLQKLDPFTPTILDDSSIRLFGGNTDTGQ